MHVSPINGLLSVETSWVVESNLKVIHLNQKSWCHLALLLLISTYHLEVWHRVFQCTRFCWLQVQISNWISTFNLNFQLNFTPELLLCGESTRSIPHRKLTLPVADVEVCVHNCCATNISFCQWKLLQIWSKQDDHKWKLLWFQYHCMAYGCTEQLTSFCTRKLLFYCGDFLITENTNFCQ